MKSGGEKEREGTTGNDFEHSHVVSFCWRASEGCKWKGQRQKAALAKADRLLKCLKQGLSVGRAKRSSVRNGSCFCHYRQGTALWGVCNQGSSNRKIPKGLDSGACSPRGST